MHVDPQTRIAGLPALKVREFLRRFQGASHTVDLAENVFQVGQSEAMRIIEELCRLGYLERDLDLAHGGELWRATLEGNALALASAAKPLRRKTAEKKLEELLHRVSIINDDPHFLHRIRKVAVFGSFLSDRQRINDIDLVVELERKHSHEEYVRLTNSRVEEAVKAGRVFGTFIDCLAWPETEAMMFLRSRSRAFSFHSSKDGILEKTEVKVLFEA